MERILITGKNSYVGNAIERLLSNYPANYSVEQFDIRVGAWETKDFSNYSIVIHVAGIAHQKETDANKELYYEVNRDLALDIALKSKAEGVKHFVFMSTMSVYGQESGMIDHHTPVNPTSHYGKSKLEAENGITLLESGKFKVAILRPPMVYGKDCKGNYPRLSKFIKKYKVFPNIRNQRSMIYIKNLAECIKLIIDYKLSGMFFPQNQQYVESKELVQSIGHVNGCKVSLIPNLLWIFNIAARISSTVAKVTGSLTYDKKMSTITLSDGKVLDYNVVDFESSIKETERD